MRPADVLVRRSAPDITSARIPGFAVRVALLAIGALLSPVAYGFTGWIAIGIALSIWAAWFPRQRLPWILILFLAASPLAHKAHLSWEFLTLLAGIHLLHVLGMLSLGVPWYARVQPKIFIAPFLRALAIQTVCQPLAIAALLLFSPQHNGHRPITMTGFGLIGAVALALAGVTLALLRTQLDKT